MQTSAISETTPITVLYVEDDSHLAELVATQLEQRDDRLTVLKEQRAQTGLERLQTTSVDCIVSDYQMPEMNGLEFLEAVRREYPTVPFILYTWKSADELAEEAIKDGVDAYLQKETGTGQYANLAKLITSIVTKHRAERCLSSLEQAILPPAGNKMSNTSNSDNGERKDRCNSASMPVAKAVADREGLDPTELDPPLYEVIDPEALDKLINSQQDETDSAIDSVVFTYLGYRISVSGDGQISLSK